MKKVSLFLGILFFGFFTSFSLAQDPGEPDTVIVECIDMVRPNSQVVLNISIKNDSLIGAFTIPLVFPDSLIHLDITCDSIGFVGTRGASASYKSDSTSRANDIENDKNRVYMWAIWFSGGLTPGEGTVAKLYFTTGPAWDSTQYVPIDSANWIAPNSAKVKMELVNAATGTKYLPAFIKGCLGEEPIIPTITVTSPNGGENWRVGNIYDITWTSQNFTGDVKIEYSTNSGSSWITVIPSTADDGIHPWTVPNTPTTQGRVRISDAATGTVVDMNDADFIISTAPIIIVPGQQTVLCDSTCDVLEFEVYATDGDNLDVLTITKIGVGDFLTVPHPSPDTGFFSWTPDPADTLNSPYTVTFIVDDGTGLADTGEVSIKVKSQLGLPSGEEGDLDGDGDADVQDVIYLVNFLFKNGPEPNPPPAGDLNCDCVTTVSDIIYFINYLFRGGPPLNKWCNPGDIDYDGYVNVPDVIYFINYLFMSGPAPSSMKSSDINADCTVDIVDLVYLINFLFRGGPIPQPGCVGCDGSLFKSVLPVLAQVQLSTSIKEKDIIVIPVSASFELPVAGVQVLVEFDPAQFEPLEPVLTKRSQNLSLFYSDKGNQQIIGLLDLRGQNSIQAGSGSIVTLRFKPRVDNYDLSGFEISEAILADREANTLQTTIK